MKIFKQEEKNLPIKYQEVGTQCAYWFINKKAKPEFR